MVRRAIFSQVCFQFVTANFLDRERGSWRRLQRLAVNAVLTEPEHDLTRPNHNLTEQRDRERGAYGGLQPNTILTEPEHDLTRPNHNLTVVNTILTEPERDKTKAQPGRAKRQRTWHGASPTSRGERQLTRRKHNLTERQALS